MKKFLLIFLLIPLAFACGGKNKAEQEPNNPSTDKVASLTRMILLNLEEARTLRNQINGWLTPKSCDGALENGKYCASEGVQDVDYSAAEYAQTPGRFTRRPITEGACYDEETHTDQGAKSTWSRDMGLGLIACAWRTKDAALLSRHAAYGRAHPGVVDGLPVWRMGEPLGDGRVLYSPSLIGIVYQVLQALGAGDHPDRRWPSVYPQGVEGSDAHLQMLDVWVRGEVSEARHGEGDDLPRPMGFADKETLGESVGLMDVSESMFARIEEHHERDSENPFYAYLHGLYSGDMEPALDLCLRSDMPIGADITCNTSGEARQCQLVHWLFACTNVAKRYGVVL